MARDRAATGRMARNKGKRGEREIIDMLQPIVDEVRKELGLRELKLKRNTLQSDSGGSDVAGLPWLALECKLHATLAPHKWWEQCVAQAEEGQEPVLTYRKDRMDWRVRMWGQVHGGDLHRLGMVVDIAMEDFLRWFRWRLVHELTRAR